MIISSLYLSKVQIIPNCFGGWGLLRLIIEIHPEALDAVHRLDFGDGVHVLLRPQSSL